MQQTDTTLLRDLGLNTLPQEEQDALNADIGEVVFAGVMRRVWESLDYHQQDALLALLKESEQNPGNEEKLTALATFLDTQVPDFTKYIHTEVEALRTVYREAAHE